MALAEFAIHGFRGFGQPGRVRFAIPTGDPGSGLTMLVGPNNGGKSTIIDGLRVMGGSQAQSFTEGKRNQQAGDRVRLEVTLDSGEKHVLRTVSSGGSETEWERPTGGPSFPQIYVLPSRRHFNPYFGKGHQERQQYTNSSSLAAVRGASLDGFPHRLFRVLANKEAFDAVLKQVLIAFPEWTIDQADSRQYYLKFNAAGQFHNSDGLGEGLVSLLFVIDALYDSKEGDVIVIDEPELSLHPPIQRRLAQLLAEYSSYRQIIYATHSPYFVDFHYVGAGAEVIRVHKINGNSTVSQISHTTADKLQGFLSNLNNPHVLELNAREAFFLDDRVILVEGQEDVVFFQKIVEQLSFELRGSFFGWGVGGANNMHIVAKLLQDLGFTQVVGILDANKAELLPALRSEFSDYRFFTIPTDDVRSKPACQGREAVVGLVDEKGQLREQYKELEKQYGADTPQKLLYRLTQDINRLGTLHVLRKGITDRSVKFRLAYFKPSSGMNPEHMKLYEKNRLTVIRQLKYSKQNENSLDMGLFLNGLPIITLELKNSLTGQFVGNAKKQYKKDRLPKGEPLLQFKRCLVHFAVGNEQVYMTTRLQGDKTHFLPFNLDTENPVNPDGHKTAYLWERILQPDSLLDIIENYIHVQKKTEKQYNAQTKQVETKESEAFIFPRFHQLDVVRDLLGRVQHEGVGHNYLIQHSAGSGKSNSIAWLAHQLASFYQNPTDKNRLFDSIIVVTDRRVLDKQLQDTIRQFEQVSGVVFAIEEGSAQLKEALEQGKSIIITTLQKFPMISESITELKGQRFAVIIDEAHSSQSGESAKHLKQTLTAGLDEAEKEDKVEFNLEDKINDEIAMRGKQDNISYFAFTATPKNKTLELFGHKVVGSDEPKYLATHIYSMRQAIEEKFILDVLENYATFARYFKLTKKYEGDKEYEKKKAVMLLTRYVDLQPHAFEMKGNIILDHFLEHTINAIQGRGRAMIVTRSRLHAVKYFLTLKNLINERGLTFKPLVAFSGTVKDPDTLQEHTEKSLNGIPSNSIPDAFKTPEYRFLIVAEKFQTGFDEPMLHTMYVDKKLAGVHAVQTISRLNRTMRGKSETIVLDFVNKTDDILKSFQDYYQTTTLDGETDPNKLYDYKTELEEYEIYTQEDVDEFAAILFNPDEPNEKLQPVLDRVVEQWKQRQDENEREEFRGNVQSFFRLYGFVSQMVTFKDIELEKLYMFARFLNRKLPKRDSKLPYEIQDAVDLDTLKVQRTFIGKIDLEGKDGGLKPATPVLPSPTESERDLLSNIINTLNDTYGADLTEEDKEAFDRNIHAKYKASNTLRDVMNGDNTKENKKYKSDKIIDDLLRDSVNNSLELYKKLSDDNVLPFIKQKLFEGYHEGSLGK